MVPSEVNAAVDAMYKEPMFMVLPLPEKVRLPPVPMVTCCPKLATVAPEMVTGAFTTVTPLVSKVTDLE